MPKTEASAPVLCSRCDKPLDTEGSPQWCKACRAAYQREYQGLKKQLSESRGYAAGCSAMRDRLARIFSQWPSARLSGAEIASRIMREPDPGAPELPPFQG
jgi:hypothetical protein